MILPVRLVELPQRRQRVGLVPRRVHLVVHIPARLVGGHRGIEGDVEGEHLLEEGVPLGAAALVDQVPLPRDLAEAVLLVVVVHLRRPWLDVVVLVQRLEQAVEVRDRAESEAGRVERVHLRDAHLAEVGRAAEAELGGLVQQRLHDLRAERVELEPVAARLLHVPHPVPRVLRGVDDAAAPTLAARAGEGIDPHAGGHDLVRRAPRLLLHGPVVGAEGDAAPGRDPVRHPQLVRVLRLGRLGDAARVEVEVDEARQDVHAGRVDFMHDRVRVALDRESGPPRLVDGPLRDADAADVDDAVPLDDDVHRPDGGRAGAVDHGGAADDEAVVRSLALVRAPVGSPDHLHRLHGRGRRGQQDQR